MPDWLVLILLFLLGTSVGTQLNRAIHLWRWTGPRMIGPWGEVPEGSPERKLTHYIPLVGWLIRRDESELLGKGFWVRPCLIELGAGIGFPLLYWFEIQGGLLEPPIPEINYSIRLTWFCTHALLICLMAIATFIDFDEKTIPDQVTIPGTLIALGIAWIWPLSALPHTALGSAPTVQVSPLRFDFPGRDPLSMVATYGVLPTSEDENSSEDSSLDLGCGPEWDVTNGPDWIFRSQGLWVGLAVIWIWCFALVPKTIVLRHGLANAWRFMWASIILQPRRTKPKRKYQVRARKMAGLTKLMAGIAVIATIMIIVAWIIGGWRWYSLLTAIIGLGFGGLTVWSVRILGSLALHKEAMGFGDVTLLAMIGAFLGWQSAFLTFALAPFAAILIVMGQFIVTRKNEIAFGPYLCLGALILIICWRVLWNSWAGPQVFVMGSMLLGILLVSLVLLFVLLTLWRMIAYR